MNGPLNVAVVSETWPPEVNGVARTLACLVEALRARGHAVQVARPRQGAFDEARAADGYSELLCAGMGIPRYPQLRMGLPARRALQQAWQRARPDIVHIA